MGLKVALESLGCKLNQAEIELLAEQFTRAGYQVVPPTARADVYVLNTCTVTHVADRKCRHRLRLARSRNPDALVVAVGCYGERAGGELAQIEGVDLVLGNQDKVDLPGRLGELGYLGEPSPALDEIVGFPFGFRTRAFVKVQDGCNNFCAYCIVPLVRGRERSLPAEEIIAEVRSRVSAGYREVVLTGVKVGAYGYDGVGLAGLLKLILAEIGVTRLRLSSLQPQEISPELIGLWDDGRLCPHFHLSLQSGSDGVLQRMRRKYSVGDYSEAVSLIRQQVPDVAITTDVIVGFPGETDEEFEESFAFVQRLPLSYLHVFTYSARPGTRAAEMPDQVNHEVRKQRTHRLRALSTQKAEDFAMLSVGETLEVVVETPRDESGRVSGIADNYLRVSFEGSDDLRGQLVRVAIDEAHGRDVIGTLAT